MLSNVMVEHGRPKMVMSDFGPVFKGEFIRSLGELHIDHSPSSAFMASQNGRSEVAVALVKRMLLLNPPRTNKNLQELTQAINSRTS